jgi:uncharacterized protein (TIGR03437 family)
MTHPGIAAPPLRPSALGAFVVFGTLMAASPCYAQGTIGIVAGNGTEISSVSGIGGPATSASIGLATGVAVDRAGNIYIADSISNLVRKVNTNGVISNYAGGGPPTALGDGGPATSARLVFAASMHVGMAVDSVGNLYIADIGDSRIRKVDASGNISTVAGNSQSLGLGGFSGDGGPATSAALNSPQGVAVDSAGNIYIADTGNGRIRKVDAGTQNITTIAGIGASGASDSGDGGPAASAQLSSISDVAVDSSGNVYIADQEHIRKVNTSAVISTVVQGFFGNCSPNPTPAASADVAANGLGVDIAGDLFIADHSASCVQELETNGTVSTVAGGGATLNANGIPATSAAIGQPYAVAVDSSGNFYIGSGSYVYKVGAQTTAPSAMPSIGSAGVVNGGSFVPGISPNSWVTITGSNLASTTASWTVTGGVLPTSLAGVSVSIGGLPAYVEYVSPGQINVLSPANLTNTFPTVVVTNSVGSSAPATVFNNPYFPAFFTWPNNQVVATHADFTWAAANGTFSGTPTVPAKPGETIILWGTGFGPTTPADPPGITTPGTQTYSTTALPTISVNLVSATVYGAALAPGFAGLYQIAFQVPASLPNGSYQLVLAIAGATSSNVPMLTVAK